MTEATGHNRSRSEAIMDAIGLIQNDLLPGDEASLTVCAVPPACRLEGDEAIAHGNSGCPLCTRLLIGEELPRA